jgi:hypothetical protein
MLPDGGILEKIQKILAKAEGTSNEEEAKIFFMKAQEMMAKNDISMEQVRIKKEPLEVIHEMAKTGKKTKAHRNLRLAHIVAKNFKCVTYIGNNGQDNFIIFMGFKSDVKVANMMFDTISMFMEKKRSQIYRQYKKEGMETKGIRESYTTGFLKGLEEGFFKNVEEKGLVVITPMDVLQEFKKMKTTSVTINSKISNPEIYNKGVKDGKGFNRELENK